MAQQNNENRREAHEGGDRQDVFERVVALNNRLRDLESGKMRSGTPDRTRAVERDQLTEFRNLTGHDWTSDFDPEVFRAQAMNASENTERGDRGPVQGRSERQVNRQEQLRRRAEAVLALRRLQGVRGELGPTRRERDAIIDLLTKYHDPQTVLEYYGADLSQEIVQHIETIRDSLREQYRESTGDNSRDVFGEANQLRHEGTQQTFVIDDGEGGQRTISVPHGGTPIVISPNITTTVSPHIEVSGGAGGAGGGEGQTRSADTAEDADNNEEAEQEQQEPTIEVQPRELDFGATDTERQLIISNPREEEEMSWRIENVPSWASVSETGGTEPGEITVTVDRAGMAVGVHPGTLRVVPGEGDPIEVSFRVEVVQGDVPNPQEFLRRHLNRAKVEAEMGDRTPPATPEEIATAVEQAKFAEYREVEQDAVITEKIHNFIDVIKGSASSLGTIADEDLEFIAQKTGLGPGRILEIVEGEFARIQAEAEKAAKSKKVKRKGFWSKMRGVALHPVTGIVAGAALGVAGFLPATMVAAGVGIQRGFSLWGKYKREKKEVREEQIRLQRELDTRNSAARDRLVRHFRTDIATEKQLEIDRSALEERSTELDLERARQDYLKNWKRNKLWKKDYRERLAARDEYLGHLSDQREDYEQRVRTFLDTSPEWRGAPESKKILYMKAVGTLFEQDARHGLMEQELEAQFGGEKYKNFVARCEKKVEQMGVIAGKSDKNKRDMVTGLLFTGARFVAHSDSVLRPLFSGYAGWKIGGSVMERLNRNKYKELQEVTIEDLHSLDTVGGLPDHVKDKLFSKREGSFVRSISDRVRRVQPSDEEYRAALLAKAREQVANPLFRQKFPTEYAQLQEYIKSADTKKLAGEFMARMDTTIDAVDDANTIALSLAEESAKQSEKAAAARGRRKSLEKKTALVRRSGKVAGAAIGLVLDESVVEYAAEKMEAYGVDVTPQWYDDLRALGKEIGGGIWEEGKALGEDAISATGDVAGKFLSSIEELIRRNPQLAELLDKAGEGLDDKRYWWRELPAGWWESSEGGKLAKEVILKIFPELGEDSLVIPSDNNVDVIPSGGNGNGGGGGIFFGSRNGGDDIGVQFGQPDVIDKDANNNIDPDDTDSDQGSSAGQFGIQQPKPGTVQDESGTGLRYDPDIHGPNAEPGQGGTGLKVPRGNAPSFERGGFDIGDGKPDASDDDVVVIAGGQPDSFDGDSPDIVKNTDVQPLDTVEFQPDGKHVWGQIEKQMPLRVGYSELWEKLEDLGSDAEEAGKTHAIDFLKDKVVEAARENPALYNIPEGVDIDHLTSKQLAEINWDKLFDDHRGELAKVFRDLDAGEVANIVANNDALREWAALHPDATLESDAGEKNFVDDVIREMRGGGAGVGAQDLEPVRGAFESSGDWETDVEAAISDASNPQEVYDAINSLGADFVKGYESELSGLLTEKFAELGYGEDIKVASIWTNADGIESVTVHYAGDAEVSMSVGMADGPAVVEQMMQQGGELKAFFDGHPQYGISHPQGIEIHSYGQTFHGFVLDLPGGNDGAVTLEIAGDPPMLRSFGVPQGTYPEDLPEGVVNKLIKLHDVELVGNEGAFKGLEDELKNQAYLARTMHGLEEKVLNPDQHTDMNKAAKLFREHVQTHPDAAYYMQNKEAAAYVAARHPDMREYFDRLQSRGASVAAPAPEASENFTPVGEEPAASAENGESSGESESAQEVTSAPEVSPEAARLKVVFEKLVADQGGTNELQEALLDNVEDNVGYSREVIAGHLQALAKEPDIPSAVTRMSPERLQVLASVVEIIPDSHLSAMDKAVFGKIIDEVTDLKAQ